MGFGAYLLRARKQGLDLVLGHWRRPLIRAWVLKKIPTCVHTSAQWIPYSINVHGHQVWTLPQCPFWGPVHRISPPNNTKVSQLLIPTAFSSTVEPRYNEGPRDWTKYFSTYFSVTGVNKIVRYTEDFVVHLYRGSLYGGSTVPSKWNVLTVHYVPLLEAI